MNEIITEWIEIRWKGDRRLKLWCRYDDFTDPIQVNGISQSGKIPRVEIEWINLKEDPACVARPSTI